MITTIPLANYTTAPDRPRPKRVVLDKIPDEIKKLGRWVLWTYELRSNAKGDVRWTKVPYSARLDIMGGAEERWPRARSNDPATWAALDLVLRYATDFDGVGFMLGKDYCGIDLDKCRDPDTGHIDEWAATILDAVGSYAEVSPSGTGVKVLVRGVKPAGRCRTGRFEMYNEGRFFTITGDRLPSAPASIEDKQEEIDRIHAAMFPAPASPVRAARSAPSQTPQVGEPLLGVEDDRILEAAATARNGEKFCKLWAGSWEDEYPSQSEADAALVGVLAFWSGDANVIDRLFRQSRLMRDKWDSPRPGGTYGSNLIQHVLAGRSEFYDWDQEQEVYALGELVEDAVGHIEPPKTVVISHHDPLHAAGAFLEEKYHQQSRQTLWHRNKTFYSYSGAKYRAAEEGTLASTIWRWLASCKTTSKEGLVPFLPNKRRVDDFLAALRAACELPEGVEAPGWLDGRSAPVPQQVIPFSNGLLDLDAYLGGSSDLAPHTPAFFSLNCLPHPFVPEACCPAWDAFLREVFEDDEERIDTLAQWFGYNLSLDTQQQKLALFVGPGRAGKGTIMRILTDLVGKENVTPMTMSHLGNQFGLEALVGKMTAVLPDAHIPSSEVVGVLERLKSIVGEDEQIINPKGKAAYRARLFARFTVSVNVLPKLPDASAALRSRLLVFPFRKSFEGNEDLGLTERLRGELPGVTNWALEGLKRLRQKGRLVQPAAGRDILGHFTRMSSPILGFIEDCCVLQNEGRVPTEELQTAWNLWCDTTGHQRGSIESLGTNLLAVAPAVVRTRLRGDGGRLRYYYTNIRLNDEVAQRVRAITALG